MRGLKRLSSAQQKAGLDDGTVVEAGMVAQAPSYFRANFSFSISMPAVSSVMALAAEPASISGVSPLLTANAQDAIAVSTRANPNPFFATSKTRTMVVSP